MLEIGLVVASVFIAITTGSVQYNNVYTGFISTPVPPLHVEMQ